MRRRQFITLLGGTAAVWPLATHAQQAQRMRQVGILMAANQDDAEYQMRIGVFKQELRKLGWSDRENVRIHERWSADNMNQIRGDAANLLGLNPDVIMVEGRRAVAVLQQLTSTFPVVFFGAGDPVATGLVTSFARPGGNFTGFTIWEYSMVGKMLETLKLVSPDMARAALVFNPDNPATVTMSRFFEAAAAPLGIATTLFPIHQRAEIELAVQLFAREPKGGLFFPPDSTVTMHREFITAVVARHRLPAIYGDRVLARSGGLMAYSSDRIDNYIRAASYADKILRGASPADLPIQNPNKYELLINLKTAKALGLEIPPSLLARADEVIE